MGTLVLRALQSSLDAEVVGNARLVAAPRMQDHVNLAITPKLELHNAQSAQSGNIVHKQMLFLSHAQQVFSKI